MCQYPIPFPTYSGKLIGGKQKQRNKNAKKQKATKKGGKVDHSKLIVHYFTFQASLLTYVAVISMHKH